MNKFLRYLCLHLNLILGRHLNELWTGLIKDSSSGFWIWQRNGNIANFTRWHDKNDAYQCVIMREDFNGLLSKDCDSRGYLPFCEM